MKKMVKVLGIVLVLLMLALPGNSVFAHEDDECECIDLVGAERNKVVSNILKSNEFKIVKSEKMSEGYEFAGADKVMAVKMPAPGDIFYTMVAMPFVNEKGELLFAVFADGIHMGDGPPPAH
ncbi:hypothetical protein V7112_12700 [Bacillus sp. JJ1566]|uniref:hypothetical protein n=1 Tax=Bacillus sp. JJ1566 TaxID=3122961 RepID=UPI002FFDDE10